MLCLKNLSDKGNEGNEQYRFCPRLDLRQAGINDWFRGGPPPGWQGTSPPLNPDSRLSRHERGNQPPSGGSLGPAGCASLICYVVNQPPSCVSVALAGCALFI
jgi:hypothetical protein